MNRRYLFGPVSAAFADQNLHRARQAGECLAFDAAGVTDLMVAPADNWERVCQRLPAGWMPDFVVLYLPYTTIPPALWAAPVPIIGLAADWNLLWHSYRHCLPACDLVLTDAAGVRALARQGIDHARAATLFGCERAFLEQPIGDRPRDIDVLFVGNLHPAVQGERLLWLGRLAALSERWRVVIEQGVFGDAYRELLGRARIVFNRGIRGEANKRAFEAAAAGALLFQEQGNLETPTYFQGGRECVYYNAQNLERLLEYYLDHEEERRQLAEAAGQRVQRYSFAELWEEHVATIAREWDHTVLRCRARAEYATRNDLLGRTWQALSAADGIEPVLPLDLAGGLATQPKCASLHNALGVVTALGGRGAGPITSQVAEQAGGYFRRALVCDPSHVVAGLNLTETLVALDQSAEATNQARRWQPSMRPSASTWTCGTAGIFRRPSITSGSNGNAPPGSTRALPPAKSRPNASYCAGACTRSWPTSPARSTIPMKRPWPGLTCRYRRRHLARRWPAPVNTNKPSPICDKRWKATPLIGMPPERCLKRWAPPATAWASAGWRANVACCIELRHRCCQPNRPTSACRRLAMSWPPSSFSVTTSYPTRGSASTASCATPGRPTSWCWWTTPPPMAHRPTWKRLPG